MPTERLTAEAFSVESTRRRRRSKYSAIPCTVDGVRFDSRREARRYQRLRLLERAGEIRDLELQPVFRLHALGGGAVAKYIADFRYVDRTGHTRVEDAKGVRTAVYRLKARWVFAEYGVRIVEV